MDGYFSVSFPDRQSRHYEFSCPISYPSSDPPSSTHPDAASLPSSDPLPPGAPSSTHPDAASLPSSDPLPPGAPSSTHPDAASLPSSDPLPPGAPSSTHPDAASLPSSDPLPPRAPSSAHPDTASLMIPCMDINGRSGSPLMPTEDAIKEFKEEASELRDEFRELLVLDESEYPFVVTVPREGQEEVTIVDHRGYHYVHKRAESGSQFEFEVSVSGSGSVFEGEEYAPTHQDAPTQDAPAPTPQNAPAPTPQQNFYIHRNLYFWTSNGDITFGRVVGTERWADVSFLVSPPPSACFFLRCETAFDNIER
ncbi:hypothetical protein H0H93_006110 [Arthromyces matolae]|nr:hypothetical protein H0H93_006110 [Arthromyces matolae]